MKASDIKLVCLYITIKAENVPIYSSTDHKIHYISESSKCPFYILNNYIPLTKRNNILKSEMYVLSIV